MKKITTLLLCLLSCVLFQACNSTDQPKGNVTATTAPQKKVEVTNINVEQFKAKMKEANIVLLDVRTPGEIAEGKISGALEIDIKGDGFAEKLNGLDKGKSYLVYCKAGGRSARACDVMKQQGFSSLYNLEGGYTAWVE